jgi:hypothetical protein
MNSYLRVLAALSVVTLSQHAAANPTLKSVTPTFHQAGGGTVQAGLVVEASTSLPVLVIAGGFTITCTTGSLVQSAENTATFVSFLGPSGKVNVPEVVPSPYPIPGWLSIPLGSCMGECVMHYKGEAQDETSLSVRIGTAGVGVNFSLIPAGVQSVGDAKLIGICRLKQKQCCTPMCAIP